ncbi:Gamma carbonic anhydrase 1, mitochondrial [Linum grandiflorum]
MGTIGRLVSGSDSPAKSSIASVPVSRTVLHGCTVEDEAFIGMGATVLDGSYVEKHAMVAAGALIRQNTRIPHAKLLRKLTEEEMAFISQSALKSNPVLF